MYDTKAAVNSTTILGGVVALIPALAEGLNHLAGTGVLPPQATVIVAAVGGVLSIIGRVLANSRVDRVF